MVSLDYIESKKEKVERLVAKIEKGGAASKKALQELKEEVGENPYVNLAEAVELLSAYKKKEAEEVLLSSLSRFPFYLPARLLLLRIYKARGDKSQFSYHYGLARRYASLDYDKNELQKLAAELHIDYTDEPIEEQSCFHFALDMEGGSLVRKRILEGRTTESYLINLYRAAISRTIGMENDSLVKAEIFKGEYVSKSVSIEKGKGDILAVSSASDEDINLSFHTPGGTVHKKGLPCNQYHYFNLPEEGTVKIDADKEIFFTHLKRRKLEGKPRLVLYLFIDGLSYHFLKEHSSKALTPNIDKFFKSAYVNENCHSTAEWTLPSVMSMTTGRYVTNHRLYHPDWNYDAEKYSKLMPEYFQDAGFLTARICCNWRTNPMVAYYKGNDRSLYCPMKNRMDASEMVTEAIEHLESFKDFHNFLWLTVEDLHSAPEGIDNSLLGSCYQEELFSTVEDDEETVSVFQKYNEDKLTHYAAEIKKIDFYLGFFFDYIEKNYNEQEFLFVLNSDHGQGFLTRDEELFNIYRTNVPLMLRGRGVPDIKSRELVSNIDILPTLLSLCSLPEAKDIDGRLMRDFGGDKRDCAYTESTAYSQLYRAAVIDDTHFFNFKSDIETNQFTNINGLLNIFNYNVKLIDRQSGKDTAEIEKEKVAYYKQVVYEHVKSWIEL